MDPAELQTFYERPLEAILSDPRGPEAHAALLEALEAGRVRAALRREDGAWEAQPWVKAAILAGFRATDLVATVPERHTGNLRQEMHSFVLPFPPPEITVSLIWHPRMEADPAHRWLRGLVLGVAASLR